MKMVDERIEQSKNKILAEMMQIVYILVALSFVAKALYFKMDLSQSITEYVILIGVPLYQLVRSRQLGVVLSANPESSLKPKTLLVSILAGIAGMLLFWYTANSQMPLPAALSSIAVFVVVFVLVRIFFVRLEKKRQDKLDHRYDDEP